MSLRSVNASGWPQHTIGDITYFSPNTRILKGILKNPEHAFWHTTYTEFACVMVNNATQTVRAVRDHVGLEPLFYYHTDTHFIFGSNLPDMIHALGFKPELNQDQLEQVLLSACGGRGDYSNNTLYQDIYRVEPGNILNITNGKLTQSKYWDLDALDTPITYQNPHDYVLHFSELLAEAIQAQTEGYDKDNIAVEFSGGLDSSTVVCGLHQLNIKPALFMHVAHPDSNIVDDSDYAFDVVKHLGLDKIQCIDATDFDTERVIKQCAALFAGTPHYLFPIGANNVHQAISNAGHRVLLSGFGGDECASMHAPLSIYFRELLHNKAWHKAWRVLNDAPTLRQRIGLIRGACPPHKSASSSTMRHYEAQLLQGNHSHHVRLRVEEAAIMGQSLGFRTQYPLLHPKLLEFCHQLPLELKRDKNNNRLMVRHYLAQFLPEHLYQKHQKIGGIMPATVHKMQQEHQQGDLNHIFYNLPHQALASRLRHQSIHTPKTELLQNIFLLCIKYTTNYSHA